MLAAAVLWGTTGTAQALAPQGAQPLAVGALRLLVSGIALGLYARIACGPLRLPRALLGPVLLGGLCMAAYQVLFFAAVKMTGVSVGTMVGIGSAPVLAGALAYVFRGERPGWGWGAATLLALAGSGLLAGAAQSAGGAGLHLDGWGMVLAVGAGGAYATFSLASKSLLERLPAEQVMALIFGLGALLLAPLLPTQALGWLAEPRGVGMVLHLGLLATALAYILFGKGLKQTPVATAVSLSLAEPLTAATLGILVLGERISWPAGLGMALIFSGLILLAIKSPGSPPGG